MENLANDSIATAVQFDLSGAATDFARKLKEMKEEDVLDARLIRVEGIFPPPSSGLAGSLTLYIATSPLLDEKTLRERVEAFVPSKKSKQSKPSQDP